MVNLIASISARVERYAVRMEQRDALRLRKANRIKTIHSSLAIEGNELSVGEVCAILDGRQVVAPLRQIQEVKNAIAAYDLYPSLNPFSIKDLLKAHGVMMQALTEDVGRFRRGGVGVFAGQNLIHMAPPASRVPILMDDLFHWLSHADDHLLIRSCVFHYEFEFIHPFSDGNGRMGRLWQSLILGKLHPVFAYLPIENMVYANTEAYYDAIAASSKVGNSTPFVEFMLQDIDRTLERHIRPEVYDAIEMRELGWDDDDDDDGDVGVSGGANVGVIISQREQMVLNALSLSPTLTAKLLAERLTLSQRQVERLLASLKKKGVLTRHGADKNGLWQVQYPC